MECNNCKGKGTVKLKPRTGYLIGGTPIKLGGTTVTCFECDGTGEKCDYCGESTSICQGQCAEENE